MDTSDWLEVGKIVSPQGLKGEVRVYPDSDFPERFQTPGQRWLLYPGASEPTPVELVSGRYLSGKGLYVLCFAGVTDRAEAEALRDCKLLVPRSDRPPLEDGEFHVMDLVGLAVFDQVTQTLVGTVTDVLPAGNDLLEVELHSSSSTAVEKPPEENPAEAVPAAVPTRKSRRRSKPKSVAPSSNAAIVLIPFVNEIVPVVDLEQRRIEITPPPGLIEGFA
ncbi:ribosome maturation factor RimM [Oculatella sp. LEGE 06141]|uniref:ribosome maturation factor RimM n=1 Tax=Oculatella sp. LEGE 06141 TaxID=1828648 RepID=UPI00187F9E73|nr:ribosome maturation factor RimM [Oculatella sp. LEGE 06141]MBE9177274.1 ribosome maturation factor RimM [Oculatella sp. LEGE 06141]